MQFDPSIAAQEALRAACEAGELEDDRQAVLAEEQCFSNEVGPTASAAFRRLQALGERHPSAKNFQAFLLYISWQQLTEDTTREHGMAGLHRCDRYLQRWDDGSGQARQVHDLRRSFRAALGLETDEIDDEYDQDVFKGGD